jgi:hypothetical protein
VLDLPPGSSADDLERLADWLEASVLAEHCDIAKSELMEELQSNALALPADESFGEDALEFGLGPEEEADDALERLADDVLAECRKRAIRLQAGYPFVLSPDLMSPIDGRACDSYAFLLVADLGHHYPALKDALVPDSHSGRLMEKVVEAASRGLFGHSLRFGWPREPGWPTSIDKRVEQLAKGLGLEVDSLAGKTNPADNDRTLDVVGMLRLENPYDATLAVLVQCAAGANWKQKLGDPSITAWHNLIQWRATLVRAVALPWRLGGRKGDWTYRRIYSLSNGAIDLDRPRLLAGQPDEHLDQSVRPEVAKWWRDAIDLIPRARPRSTAREM